MANWQLTSVLDLSTVPELWLELQRRIHANPRLTVNLSGVQGTSSAALALLLQGLEEAQKSGCELHFEQIPPSLLALAKVSNVDDLLIQH